MSQQNESKRLIIIDGTAFVFRARFGIQQELTNSAGQPTNAIYSFTTTLFKVLREEQPEYLAICFDRGGKSGRTELLAAYKAEHPEEELDDYKADRPDISDNLVSQIPYIRRIIEALGIPIVEMTDYEADDVVGTLARRAEADGFDVLVMTNDKDMFQLISPKIKIHRATRYGDEFYDIAALKNSKYMVEPDQIPDYLALVGDKIDRIPGVDGMGEKSVPGLLAQFGTVENMLDNLDDVQKRYRTKLAANREIALLGKRLATLQTDLDIPITPEGCKRGETDTDTLLELFQELEFNRLRNQIPRPSTEQKELSVTYKTVTTEADLDELIRELKGVEEFAVDLETTSTNPIQARIVGIAISTAPGSGYYIPTLNMLLDTPELLPEEAVFDRLRPFLEDAQYRKVGHNIKYDLKVFARHGVDLNGIAFDTMIASSLLHASASHGLDDLAFTHLGYKTVPIEDLIGKGKNQKTMDTVPLDQITEYACEDADITLQLKERFASELHAEGLEQIFNDTEVPLIPILADMELAGIAVDADYLRELSDDFESRMDGMMERVYTEAGEEFNINSPKQLGHILFDVLKLPKTLTRKTKTGYSTNVRVLENLIPHHPLPALILEYRSFAKLKSTYTDALVGLIDPNTTRLHTSFHQAVARTGRLSSSDPNLQNIPVRTAEGREIRRAFVAKDDDHTLIVADYSQIELRILAHLSGDERLREAFQQDMDIHAQAASLIFGVSLDDVDLDMRRQAKTMNYGIVYGIGPFRLSNELKIEFDEAQQLIQSYFETYAGVRTYFDQIVAEATEMGYVTTMLGHRCYVPEIHVPDRNTREFGKRAAINAPMQGTAAELIKLAMLQIHDHLNRSGKKTKMLLQVHDELVFEGPKSEQETVVAEIQNLMENACPLDVPVKVEIHAGQNWLEAK